MRIIMHNKTLKLSLALCITNGIEVMYVPKIDQIGVSEFLHQYDQRIIEQIRNSKIELQEREKNIIKLGTVLREPANKQNIVKAEKRLGITLPDSYKNFLKVSNGIYSIYGEDENESIWPIERIIYLSDYRADLIDDWLNDSIVSDIDYFNYSSSQNSVLYRSEYLESTIAISSEHDGYIFLINPKISVTDGELEIWDLSHRYPGAFRYKSFDIFLEYFYKESIGTIASWSTYT